MENNEKISFKFIMMLVLTIYLYIITTVKYQPLVRLVIDFNVCYKIV